MAYDPSDSPESQPLAVLIAMATRASHSKLNKLIIARLPLALPPLAENPSAYVSGLLHIAPIYITFETLWQNMLDSMPLSSAQDQECPQAPTDYQISDYGKPERMHAILGNMYLPSLMRSSRLRADIRSLTGWPEAVVQEQLDEISSTGPLADYIRHIRIVVGEKPHTLLTYSYIMFMALFAGGRYIRASLESAGDSFWNTTSSPIQPTSRECQSSVHRQTEAASLMGEADILEATSRSHKSHAAHAMPLRFFHFESATDGEDLKRDFKKRLTDSEAILTEQEKQDVIDEATCIFEYMIKIVHQLDTVCPVSEPSEGWGDQPVEELSYLLRNPLGSRFRDSVAVAKERKYRSASRSSTGSEDGICTVVKSYRKRRTEADRPTHASHSLFHDQGFAGHPTLSGQGNVELCPGMAKSMRFDTNLPMPSRRHQNGVDGAMEVPWSLRTAPKRVRGANITNWVLLAAFGAIVITAFMSGQRSVARS